MEEDVQVSTPAAKNTSATWYRINDMFKPKIARLECPTCGRSYNSNKSLRKHFKIHLPGYEPPKYRTVTVKETAETHKFVCDICGRRFMRKSNLTRHLKNHDIIRICEGCGKKHNDCQAHYNHKRKCKAYLTIYPKKDRAGRDETGDTKRWIETTEEYLSVYQHKCQMCQSRFALREHLDTHTEYCGDPFWLEDKGDHLKLLNENLRKANAERRRKVAFLKVVKKVNGEKQDKRNETVGCKRIKIDQMKRIKKLTFRPSAMGVVSHKVRKKYKATQKSLGKNSEKKKELLRKFKRKVNQRLLKCKQIIQRNTWYKCKLCGTFGRAESIINHLKGPTHKLQTPIVCGACTRDFRTLQDFSFHQALHSHKICRNSLMIRYTTIVHADKIKHALNHHERMKKSLACAVNVELKTGKQTVEWKTASKPDSTVVDHYQGKCLCGIVMRNLKEMMNHVSKVHKMILAFKCKHCITDNIFQNMSDFVKHLASQHSRRKICQTDFEEKFLLPLGNPSTKVLVNNMTFQEQSSATASLDTEPGAEIVGEENMKKEESGELTESQLIAKQNEFVKLALRQKFKEKVQVGKLRKSEEQVDVETMDTKRRKGPLLEEKNIVKAKGSSAAKKRRREREQIMEKYQETSSKLRAKQSLRKYKSIMGWKHKKNIKQHRLKTNVRYRPRVQKSRFLLNNQFALRDCLYQCSVCERYRIDKAQEIITHLSKVHNKQAVLECSLCRSIFCSLTQLSAHQYQHSNIKGEIGINILYTSIVNPRVGMNISQTDRTVQINDETQTLLSGNYPSQCHLCKKTFKSQLALLSHIRYIHNLVFGYKCRSCDQGIVFMEFQEFYDHTKKVHGKLNLSEADFEQVTVIKHQYEEQGAATSKTNVAPTRKQKTTIIHPANMYFVDLKAVKASVQANNPTPTQNVPKSRSRPIRPKYDPAFEYGEEVSLLSKRRKLDEPLPSKMTFCAGGATLLVPVSSNVPLVVKPDKSISNKMLTQDKPVTSCVPPALDKPVTSCVPLAVDKPVTSCVPLAKILSVTDQNGKEVTILVKGEPAEPANERNTSREEYSCGFCGKRFRFKIMLNQHMERMHKMHSREKREKAKQILQEKLLKGDIRLKKNVASKLRDMKVELDDIAKDVTISGNTMFMNSVNQNTLLQNQKRQVSSKVNAISTKKKSGGKKKSGWSDHNYVAKRVDQEPSEDTLLQCIFKQCSYKCKTENCMKKHMIRKHKKSNLPKLQPKIAEPKERSKDGNEEIYSGDSEHADMAELDDSAYKVESEADSEEEESCKLKTIKKNQKHSHTAQGKEEKQMYGMADVKMGYKSVFKCTEKDCNKTFTARDFMADHKKSAHGKDMMYVCNVCSLEYARMPCFRDHLNISHRDLGTVPFKIAESEIRSKDMNLIEVLICTVCGYGGTTENLKSHICKADTHKYYCPFCDKERNSSIYEEIRDHIDKEHSENTVQQTAGKHDTGSDSIEAGSSMPTVHTAATETITENSGGPEPPENTISSKSTDDHTNTESATSSGDAETGDTAASKNRDSADIETVTAGGGVVVPDKLGAQDSDVLAEEQTERTEMSPQDLKIDTLTTYKEGPTLSTDELIPHDKELSPDNQEPTPQIEMSTSVAKEPGPAPSTKRFECGFCGLTFKREFTRNIHKLDHTGEPLKAHVCGLCGFSYQRFYRFRRHMKVHQQQGSFECRLCSRQFKTQTDLDWHATLHSRDVKPFECSLCGTRYSDLKVARRHARQKHSDLNELERINAIQRTDTAIHKTDADVVCDPAPTPHNKPFECRLCSIGYTDVKAGRKHAQKKHSDLSDLERINVIRRTDTDEVCEPTPTPHNKPFECSLCSSGYTNVKAARRHARQKHTDISVAERHMAIKRTDNHQITTVKIEEEKTETVEGSDQTAGSKTTETETGELIQLCQCEQCPYTSTRLVDLKKHVQKVHLIYRHQTDDDKLSTDTEKSDVEKTVNKASSDRSEPYENVIKLLYKCTIENCGKVTSSQKSLRKHRKNDHDLIMNFTCPVCTNEYGVIKSLKIHMAQSHSSFDRLPLQITDAKIYKPKNYYAAKRLKMYACSESVQEVMICVPCGMVGTNEMLDSHCCLPKVPTFYCPCCEKPKSVSSENREEIREHIRREHGLDIGTETVGGAGDIGDADLVVATEQTEQMTGENGHHQGKAVTAETRFFCVHCKQLFTSQFDKNMHEMEHSGMTLQQFVCGLCGVSYPRSSAYNKHAMSHREYKYKCDQCHKAFPEKADLDRHANTHSGDRPFQCDICGNRYCDLKECKKHMKIKHPDIYFERYAHSGGKRVEKGGELYVCDQCGEMFRNSKQWNHHNINYHGHRKRLDLACSLCPDKIFKTKRLLHKHIQKHKHDEEMVKKTQEKGKTPDPKMQLHESVKGALTDSDSLKTVYQQLHIVNKNDKDGLPHMCSICSKKFRKAKYLYVHIRQIHTNDESKKYRCTECGRGFILIHSFRMHMRTHTNSRPYKCRLCEKSFKQRAHIRDHLLSHSSKFRTSCCICGKAFKGKGSAKSHILSHCKTKPFSCPVCPEKFADMGQLTNHFSNIPHSQSEKKGELLKMFKCPMCTTFQCEQKHDMLRHFDNHTMEKHFQCEKCNVKFRRYLELYYHKTKFDHFVDSDFEGVTKITCPTVWKNIRSSEIFDQYTLEELQTMFVYQPDTSELSRPELEEMVNPKVVSDYDDELWYLRKKNAKTQAPKRNVSNEDLEDIEYKEVNSAEVSQQNTDIEYEDDLLTVAEQLTHMADMDQTGYPEVVIPSSMADKTDNKPAFVTIDSNQDIFTQANQLQLDSNFDIGSPWSTDFLIKTPSHKNILYQDHSGRYNAGSNSAVVQTPSYSKTTQEETASATNNLLQENNIESGLTNVNSHFTSANLKSEVVRSAFKPVAASAKSPVEQTYQTTQTVAASKPAVQQTFNIIDESGNEMLVYVLNETAENNDILNIIQSGGSDCKTTVSVATANASMDIGEHKLLADGRSKASAGFLEDIPDMDEMERNTGFNVTVSDNRTAAFTAGNRTQLHMNRDEKPITSHINTDQSLAQRNTSKEQISSAKLLRGSRIFVEDYLNKLDEAQKEVIQAAKKDPDYHPDSSDDSSGEEEEEEDDKDTQVKFRQIKLFNKHNENTGDYPCGICGKRFKTAKLRNVHAKIHLPDHLQRFRCPDCGKGFSRGRALQLHMTIHTGARDWKCDICERSFSQQGHLKTHKLTHLKDKPFKCSHCSWSGTTMSMMRRHVREKHDVGKQWKCQLCDKSFVDRQDLKRHAVTHLSKTARDEIVAKASSITPKDNGDSMAERPESLASNSTESKVQETPQSLVELYICDVCGKTYNKQYSLSLHRQTKHTEGDDFKCDQCERGFPTALTLKEHKKNHKWQDPMPCDRCGKILKSRSGLRKHIQVIHEGKNKEVNFKCLKCKKGFYKERHFLCHVTVCCPKQGGYHFIPAEQS